jgi:hypothetical protein
MHPNALNTNLLRVTYDAAVTDEEVIAGIAGQRLVVTRVSAGVHSASSNWVGYVLGFGAEATPTAAGAVASNSGLQPGKGGDSVGDGSGILGVGADGEGLFLTAAEPTDESWDLNVAYYWREA